MDDLTKSHVSVEWEVQCQALPNNEYNHWGSCRHIFCESFYHTLKRGNQKGEDENISLLMAIHGESTIQLRIRVGLYNHTYTHKRLCIYIIYANKWLSFTNIGHIKYSLHNRNVYICDIVVLINLTKQSYYKLYLLYTFIILSNWFTFTFDSLFE